MEQGPSNLVQNAPKGSVRDEEEFSFVTVDHPGRFRTSHVRKLVKKHVRRDRLLKRRTSDTPFPGDVESGIVTDRSDPEPHHIQALPEEGEAEEEISQIKGRDVPIVQSANRGEKRVGSPVRTLHVYHPKELPRFKDQTIDVGFLLNYWFSAFGLCAPENYLNILFASKMALLSYSTIPTFIHSLYIQQPGCSVTFLTARHEIFQRLNQALSTAAFSDETIMSVKHQLFIDFFVGSKNTIKSHVKGLAQLVFLRSRPNQVPIDSTVVHQAKIHVLLACVLAEIRVPFIFQQLKTTPLPFLDPSVPTPKDFKESPLLWWTEHMSSLAQSSHSTPRLHSLCCELRDMTRALLFYGTAPPAHENSSYQQLVKHHFHPVLESDLQGQSASSRQSAWVYESCRLAGLIYATAIAHHIPISQAWKQAAVDFETPFIVEDLGSAIFKTGFFTDNPGWGELMGTYLWVVFIAATSGYHNLDQTKGPRRTEELLKRTLLTQPFTFTFGLFHDPLVTDRAQDTINTMLRVQEILAAARKTPSEGNEAAEVSSETEAPIRRARNALYDMTLASCTKSTFQHGTSKTSTS